MNTKAYPRAYLQCKVQLVLRNSDLNGLFSENFSLLCNCKFTFNFRPEHPSVLKDKNQFGDAITKMNCFVYLSQCILCDKQACFILLVVQNIRLYARANIDFDRSCSAATNATAAYDPTYLHQHYLRSACWCYATPLMLFPIQTGAAFREKGPKTFYTKENIRTCVAKATAVPLAWRVCLTNPFVLLQKKTSQPHNSTIQCGM